MKKIILFFLFFVFSSFLSAISQHPNAILSKGQRKEPPKKRPGEIPEARKVLNPEDYAPVYIPVDELTISTGKKEGFIWPLLGVNARPTLAKKGTPTCANSISSLEFAPSEPMTSMGPLT